MRRRCPYFVLPRSAFETMQRIATLPRDQITAAHTREYDVAQQQTEDCELPYGHEPANLHRSGDREWLDPDPEDDA